MAIRSIFVAAAFIVAACAAQQDDPFAVPPLQYLEPLMPATTAELAAMQPAAALRLRPVTALCRDGWYSYSEHRGGTCSGHGGRRGDWINRPPT